MSYPLIVVCGNAHSGKDTLVSSVANKRIFTTSFAGTIKDFLINMGANPEHLYGPSNLRSERLNLPQSDWEEWQTTALAFFDFEGVEALELFDFLIENPTCREALRFVGDTVRKYDPDYFARETSLECSQMLGFGDCDLAIISDGRFRNEILKVKEMGGTAILVSSDMSVIDEHRSEKELAYIPNKWFDYVINNDKGHLESAQKEFKSIVEAKSGIRI